MLHSTFKAEFSSVMANVKQKYISVYCTNVSIYLIEYRKNMDCNSTRLPKKPMPSPISKLPINESKPTTATRLRLTSKATTNSLTW